MGHHFRSSEGTAGACWSGRALAAIFSGLGGPLIGIALPNDYLIRARLVEDDFSSADCSRGHAPTGTAGTGAGSSCTKRPRCGSANANRTTSAMAMPGKPTTISAARQRSTCATATATTEPARLGGAHSGAREQQHDAAVDGADRDPARSAATPSTVRARSRCRWSRSAWLFYCVQYGRLLACYHRRRPPTRRKGGGYRRFQTGPLAR